LYQCGLALKNGHFKNYASAIRDASRLAGPILKIRKSLKTSTFEEISRLRRQAIPPIRRVVGSLPARGFSLTDPS
jgi:hypothetical protein